MTSTSPRSAALQALAEKWPDQTHAATCSPSAPSRMTTMPPGSAALQALAEKWPDETTRDLLAQRAVQASGRTGAGRDVPRWARCTPSLAASCRRETLDGIGPYLDPLEPIPRDHIERAASEPASVPTTSTPSRRRSRPTWDGTSPAGRSHPVKTRSEENVPERVNSTK